MGFLLNFDPEQWNAQVLKARPSVLVDFQTPWMGPFLSAREDLEKLARQLGEGWDVGIMDTSRVMSFVQAHRVHEEPVLALFRSGRLIWAYSGLDRITRAKDRLLDACTLASTD